MPLRPKPLPPTVVVLVRHALTPTTGKELPERGAGPSLSEQGRRQAEEAARRISSWRATLPPLTAIYSSPMARALETAAAIGAVNDLVPVEMTGLVDCDTGDWAGQALKDLARKPEWTTVMHYPSGFCFPGGESIAEMHSRVVGTVRGVIAAHPGRCAVVVSHAEPIKAVLADALGVHLDLFQRFVVAPASVSAINYAHAGPSVMLVNWTGPSGQVADKRRPSTSSGSRH